MPLSEHVYCVAITFKMTEWVDQRTCIKLCISLWKLFGCSFKGHSYGPWWLAASSWQCASSCNTSCVEFFLQNIKSPGDSAPRQPRFGALWLQAFPQTKITFERGEISYHRWVEENTMGQLLVIGRTVWGPKVPTLKETETSLSCVQCFLYFISSSITVSIFHITWLDTLWTDLVCHCTLLQTYRIYNIRSTL